MMTDIHPNLCDPARREPTDAAPRATRDRPRLLSYVGRWGRARRWLPADARAVVDIGCSYGYGTAALTARGSGRRWVVGVEPDARHIAAAGRSYPWIPLVRGDAESLPLRDASMDAAVMLDVLEHVSNPEVVLDEIRRVVRPGGYLIVSVPNRGLLAGLDPKNVYPSLRRRFPSWLPLDAAEESATGHHLHFSLDELTKLLGPGFAVDRTARSGLGVSEVFALATLVTFKGLIRRDRLWTASLPLHMITYVVDDLIPFGRFGYHLTLRARVLDSTMSDAGVTRLDSSLGDAELEPS